MNASVTAATRGLAPIVGGSVLAWTSQAGLPFPLDYHFVFLLCSAAATGAAYAVYRFNPLRTTSLVAVDDEEARPLLSAAAH